MAKGKIWIAGASLCVAFPERGDKRGIGFCAAANEFLHKGRFSNPGFPCNEGDLRLSTGGLLEEIIKNG